MRAILTLLIALAITVYSLPSQACDTEATATPTSTCVVTTRDGRRGLWFEQATADKLGREHVEAPIMARLLEQHRNLVAVQSLQIRSLEAANADSIKAAEVATKALHDERDANATQIPWWVWTSGGAVLGGALTGVVVYEVTK